MKFKTILLAFSVAVLLTSTALAHPMPTGVSSNGLVAGFAHPWLGFDHLLAMVAVGLIGVQIGGRAIWVLPSSFIGAMVFGAVMGIGRIPVPYVESGIALSVIVLGGVLVHGRRYPLVTAAFCTAACGLMHGHAHGAEIPAMVAPFVYIVGFTSATALLHFLGIAAGIYMVRNPKLTPTMQFSGAAILSGGLILLMSKF